MLPSEMLRTTDSRELSELYAYLLLEQDPQKQAPAAAVNVEDQLRKVFGKPNG